jgi:hypothetical protein
LEVLLVLHGQKNPHSVKKKTIGQKKTKTPSGIKKNPKLKRTKKNSTPNRTKINPKLNRTKKKTQNPIGQKKNPNGQKNKPKTQSDKKNKP